MKYIYFTFILGIALFSCKKKGKADFTLKGTLTDATYSIPMDGANVQLFEKIAGNSSYDLIGSSSTDGSGSYSFTFPRNSVESYKIIITKDLYFDIDQMINFSDLSIENDNIRNFSTTAKSWAKLRFINQSPSALDVLKYTQTEGKQGCDLCCPSGEHTLMGAVDTTIYCINDGNTTYAYSFLNGSLPGSKSAMTTAFDTTEILLTY